MHHNIRFIHKRIDWSGASLTPQCLANIYNLLIKILLKHGCSATQVACRLSTTSIFMLR